MADGSANLCKALSKRLANEDPIQNAIAIAILNAITIVPEQECGCIKACDCK